LCAAAWVVAAVAVGVTVTAPAPYIEVPVDWMTPGLIVIPCTVA
jgi:hypothetical protein